MCEALRSPLCVMRPELICSVLAIGWHIFHIVLHQCCIDCLMKNARIRRRVRCTFLFTQRARALISLCTSQLMRDVV